MKNILVIKNLSKQFGSKYALNNISISLTKGKIYGFVGSNGAGKTTLLKIITGLAYPTSGTLEMLGKSQERGLKFVRRYIGSTIEGPVYYPNYSVTDNLRLQQILLKGKYNREEAEKVLNLVGLDNKKNLKAHALSTGMKQKLAIASCLLGQPEFLLLDEPVNGLDPQGMANFRELILKLNKEKKITILMSSHILSELYMLASDFIFIDRGKILDVISAQELENRLQKHIRIKMQNMPVGLSVIEKVLKINDYKILNDCIHIYNRNNNLDFIAETLHKNNIIVTHISLCEETLEEYYFSLIGGVKHG